jgi:hypothetical protein
MQDVADQSAAPTTIGADLCAIFVSLELSRSTWLATSLSPGRGEKMSKHSVVGQSGRRASYEPPRRLPATAAQAPWTPSLQAGSHSWQYPAARR